MFLVSYFKPENLRRFFYGCGVLFVAVLIGVGVLAQRDWLVYGSEGDELTAGSNRDNLPVSAVLSNDATKDNENTEAANAEVENTEFETLSPPPAGAVAFDFTNDGKADIGRWNPAASEFRVKNSTTGAYTAYTIGNAAAKAAPGRFDSDTMTDPAVFNAGTWTIRRSSNGTTFTIAHGQAGDIPVAGNYETADSITDAAVFRPSTNTWLVRKSSNAQVISTVWGQAGDIPVPGNYDG